MADSTRRSFLGTAAFAAVAFPRRIIFTSPALDDVEIDCGFKADPANLEYGRAVRERLHNEVAECVRKTRSMDSVVDVVERIAANIDATRIRELWLSVSGTIRGQYRHHEFVVEL